MHFPDFANPAFRIPPSIQPQFGPVMNSHAAVTVPPPKEVTAASGRRSVQVPEKSTAPPPIFLRGVGGRE
jgi:hypothetical protein